MGMTLTPPECSADRFEPLLTFIRDHWEDTLRFSPNDEGDVLGLPHPYTVPCRKTTFQELYYWDTFYTNEGLLAQGRVDLARQNVDNILHLVGRFGYMPNGNRTYYLTRSQPPHLALMVQQVFIHTRDRDWLRGALARIEDELAFWHAERRAPCGLNHYGHHAERDELASWVGRTDRRVEGPAEPDDRSFEEKLRSVAHSYAECESGWDFSPRFGGRCMDFCPVDLNALLFASEQILSRGRLLLGERDEARLWTERSSLRARLMRELLWSRELGAFMDYDHVRGRLSAQVSAASFYPVWLGLTTPAETASTLALLPYLERAHGILACAPGPRTRHCQWDAPNAWPPLQYSTVKALLAGGARSAARRVASGFVETVARNLARTGDLWEKYNAETGGLDVRNEYELPSMMGWTAGVGAALAGFVLSCDREDEGLADEPDMLCTASADEPAWR